MENHREFVASAYMNLSLDILKALDCVGPQSCTKISTLVVDAHLAAIRLLGATARTKDTRAMLALRIAVLDSAAPIRDAADEALIAISRRAQASSSAK